MHELGVCESIVQAVDERADGRRVREIAVTVGGGHAADEAALRHAFELAAAGTALENAVLDVRLDPMRVRCASCRAETEVSHDFFTPACPRCGSVDVDLAGAQDLVVERVVMERDAAKEE